MFPRLNLGKKCQIVKPISSPLIWLVSSVVFSKHVCDKFCCLIWLVLSFHFQTFIWLNNQIIDKENILTNFVCFFVFYLSCFFFFYSILGHLWWNDSGWDKKDGPWRTQSYRRTPVQLSIPQGRGNASFPLQISSPFPPPHNVTFTFVQVESSFSSLSSSLILQ